MKIIINRADGGISIMSLVGDANIDTEIEKIKPMLPTAYVSHRIVDDAEIQTDRTFRNAWKSDLSVDMVKATGIAQERIRAARAPKLTTLDVEFMRAVEAGDAAKQAQIATQKQRLRDATSDARLTNAQTPEALKSAMEAVIVSL